MARMECPLCGKENPHGTQRCHCGHVFQKTKWELSDPYIKDGKPERPLGAWVISSGLLVLVLFTLGSRFLLPTLEGTVLESVSIFDYLFVLATLLINIAAAANLFWLRKAAVPWLYALLGLSVLGALQTVQIGGFQFPAGVLALFIMVWIFQYVRKLGKAGILQDP